MPPITSPFCKKKCGKHAFIHMKFQIIKSNYLDQVHNKIFNKALHRQVKILKKASHTVIITQ